MLIATFLYCIGGAYLYGILEASTELAKCQGNAQDMAALISNYTGNIFNYLTYNVTFNPILLSYTADNSTVFLDGPDIYNQVIYDYLIGLRDDALSNGYGGLDCEVTNSWVFLSALLWTITVVTSIGIYIFLYLLKLGYRAAKISARKN